MKSSTTLSVLVPVYNEEHLVATSLERLMCLADSPLLERVQIIVVDDGSSDQTGEAISRFKGLLAQAPREKLSWLFIRHEKNQGKAAAIHTALSAATEELTVIHDADLEYHPADLVKMVEVFLAEQADAVFGSRFLASEYRRVLFFRHELGNRFLTLLCNVVSDLNLSDMETCYKMVRTTLLKSIPLTGKGFEIEPEITIKLAKRGARIFEVPIRYAGRTYQEGKKIGWRDGVRAVRAIFRFSWSDQIYVEDTYGSQILGRLNRAPRFTEWMADVIRPYVGQKVLEIGAGTGNLTAQLIPRVLYWATDINPLYLMYLGERGPQPPLHEGGLHRRGKRGVLSARPEIRYGDLPECCRTPGGRSGRAAEYSIRSRSGRPSDYSGALRAGFVWDARRSSWALAQIHAGRAWKNWSRRRNLSWKACWNSTVWG